MPLLKQIIIIPKYLLGLVIYNGHWPITPNIGQYKYSTLGKPKRIGNRKYQTFYIEELKTNK
jgi:hypothetical protein